MIKVLIPTDFSDNARLACQVAVEQFDHSKSIFLLYHSVIQPRSYSGMLVNITDIMLSDANKRLAEEIDRLKETFGQSLNIKSLAKVGYLQDALPSIIRKELIDFIVMGTRGENRLVAKVIGTNTEQVIRKSTIPVLAIPYESGAIDLVNIAIATVENKLLSQELLTKIFTSLRLKSNIEALTILTNPQQRAFKSIELGGLQIPVSAIKSENAIDGINIYLSQRSTDLLVVYHHHNARLDYLFRRSVTKKLSGEIQIPLLVMPG